jgi:hypothetical protein
MPLLFPVINDTDMSAVRTYEVGATLGHLL